MANGKHVDSCGGLKPIIHPPIKREQSASKAGKKTVKKPSKTSKK